MTVQITEEAAAHYQREMQPANNEVIRLFVRVGGVGSGGFSLGVQKEGREQLPETSWVIEKAGAVFVVHENDQWYMENLTVDYDSDMDYVQFKSGSFHHLDHPS
ncbi:uncharacterized protein YneR [Salsuginibacillus halophilus]|uniref:Uncharacterized protein YneR n=1 Tax=Salsuginibacillus halophilus TaxID=517424 RepID=A0A2P8HYQ2_9BACI|nr:iron-sulfur cluster biosynthesis family protein [Salsuginibacillus halophilus]PSL51361.1 uncharacterized protein YneR [Salsuginibacillus halophilus]